MGIASRIQDTRFGTAGASGIVTVTFGPVPPWCQWVIDGMSIGLSRGTGRAQVFHGPTPSAPIPLDATRIAQSNTNSPDHRLYQGETVTVQFALLQAGVVATATIRATQSPYP